MPKYAYKDVIAILLEHFPEFTETENFKHGVFPEIAYSVWGAFGQYITDYMLKLPASELDSDELVARTFDLANELLDSGDDETQTIVVIELFENFYSYRKTLNLARRKLLPRHLHWLEKQGQWISTSDQNLENEPGED